MLAAFHVNHSRVAIWFTGMVDESCCIAVHGSIHHIKVINAEHVAANSLQTNRTIRRCSDTCFSKFYLSVMVRKILVIIEMETNLAIVVLLPFVSEHWANDNSCIFNNHLPCFDVPFAEKTATMDSRPTTGVKGKSGQGYRFNRVWEKSTCLQNQANFLFGISCYKILSASAACWIQCWADAIMLTGFVFGKCGLKTTVCPF